MMALGLTNMVNSFVIGAFTVSAGMSRSTVNYQANAATQISAWITAVVIMIAVGCIAQIFVYIPSATLGAVIIVSASSLFNSNEWKRFWTVSKRDFIPFIITFAFALRKSSLGLILGIISHLVLLLAKFTKPIQLSNIGNTLVLEGRVMFPSGDVRILHSWARDHGITYAA